MAEVVAPIHPDMLPKLDPEFVAYYNAHFANRPPMHELPWDPAFRNGQPVTGFSEPLRVGFIKDVALTKCKVRVYCPADLDSAPLQGWPALLYFHGGEYVNCAPHFSN